MARSTDRRRSRQALVSLGCAFAGLAACIDTQLEDTAPVSLCPAEATPASAASALVWIRVDLGDSGYRYCSAVAISTRLVITADSCIAYPGDLDPEAPNDTDSARFPSDRQTYFDPAEYQAYCERNEAWTAIEDGSFRSRTSAPVPLADIGVGRTGEVDRPTVKVEALVAAGSSSRCNESVAVLLLSEDLDVVAVPLRLDDSGEVGEPVLTSGIVPNQGRFVRRDQSALVEQVTLERGDESIPPQSLLLETPSCYLSRGGPVLSEASGALLALVAWGQSPTCDDGVTGSTVALRLAPYRALILEAASTYGQTLFSERKTGSVLETPGCGL